MKQTEYTKQANDFLKKTKTTMTVEFLKTDKYFLNDKEKRDIYNITLKRGKRSYTFSFGQSINDSGYKSVLKNGGKITKRIDTLTLKTKYKNAIDRKNRIKWEFCPFNIFADKIIEPIEPDAYSVLASLEKQQIESFEEFCSLYGYNSDSISAEKIYKACKEQYTQLCCIFNSKEMEDLQEIY